MDAGVEQTIVWAISKGGAGCRGFAEDSSMRWERGVIWDMAGLWGITQSAQLKSGEPVISVA